MSVFVACKLPHGLNIQHQGKSLLLRGTNFGFNPSNPQPLGLLEGDANGYGLTELNDDQAKLFDDWKNSVTYNGGDKAKGKLSSPFQPLENGSIVGPFKSRDEAVQETAALSDMVRTGFEGIDPDKDLPEGLETNDEAMAKSKRGN